MSKRNDTLLALESLVGKCIRREAFKHRMDSEDLYGLAWVATIQVVDKYGADHSYEELCALATRAIGFAVVDHLRRSGPITKRGNVRYTRMVGLESVVGTPVRPNAVYDAAQVAQLKVLYRLAHGRGHRRRWDMFVAHHGEGSTVRELATRYKLSQPQVQRRLMNTAKVLRSIAA